ncbi:dehydroquinate synthase/iron-containing alcohol dehydrogenase family protein [Collinsella provencensis]|uniref:hypothetical protein n=1 Tax=Collinsella provencensis TaxID=1937461 RepID=UPI000C848AB0|nr:hypothetical protein [Collinsella provencensis]
MTIRRQLLNFGGYTTDYRMGCGALDELPRLLGGSVGKACRAFLLYGASEDESQVECVRRALIDGGFSVSELTVEETRATAFSTVERVLHALATSGITGEDLLVGFGDASVCSLASFSSRMWAGRLSCALIPTTLDAMITCPTAAGPFSLDEEGAAAGQQGLVSLMPEATLVVCDLDLVRTASFERNALGFVRMVAAALTDSRRAWEGFEKRIEGLLSGGEIAYIEGVGAALTARLNTVKSVSPASRKAFMYGETTAHALRACLGSQFPEYQLLAEGLRFEARIAVDAFGFSVDSMFLQDDYLEDLGVEELTFELEPEVFIEALKRERFREANRFQLALPKNPGIIRLTSVDDEILERHARAFLSSRSCA